MLKNLTVVQIGSSSKRKMEFTKIFNDGANINSGKASLVIGASFLVRCLLGGLPGYLLAGLLCCCLLTGCKFSDIELWEKSLKHKEVDISTQDSKLLDELPFIVFDLPSSGMKIKKYRSARHYFSKFNLSQEKSKYPFSIKGLDALHASASGQFSEAGLLKIVKRAEGRLVIVDLRQETHGFINGQPVTWYGFRNQHNVRKAAAEIEQEESYLLAGLKHVGKVKVFNRSKTDIGEMLPINSKVVKVTDVLSEAELVHKHGHLYKRFFIRDHHRPTDKEVDAFVEFVKALPANVWLHFHCCGGSGRSTTFMLMYDMIRNAHEVGVEDIIARQKKILGIARKESCGLEKKAKNKKEWKLLPASERKEFVRRFYDYVVDAEGYAKRSWTSWLGYRS